MENINTLGSNGDASLYTSSATQHHLDRQRASATPKDSNGTSSWYSSPTYGLEDLGMKNLGQIYRNLSIPQLVERVRPEASSLITVLQAQADPGAFINRQSDFIKL